MDNNNEMNLSEATEALCIAESAVESMDEMIKLFGVFDENLKVISAETGARIIAAGDCIRIEGSAEAAELAKTVVDKLLITVRRGENVDRSRIRYAVDLAKEGNADLITELESDVVAFTAKGRRIKCNVWPEEICECAQAQYGSVRRWPRRHGQNISCRCNGRIGI